MDWFILDSLSLPSSGASQRASAIPNRPRRHSVAGGPIAPHASSSEARPPLSAGGALRSLLGAVPEAGPQQFEGLRALLRTLAPWQAEVRPLWPQRSLEARLALHVQALCFIEQAALRTWHSPELKASVVDRLRAGIAQVLSEFPPSPSPSDVGRTVLAMLCGWQPDVAFGGRCLWLQALAHHDDELVHDGVRLAREHGATWLSLPGLCSEPIALFDVAASDVARVLAAARSAVDAADPLRLPSLGALRALVQWPQALPLCLCKEESAEHLEAARGALWAMALQQPTTTAGIVARRGLDALAECTLQPEFDSAVQSPQSSPAASASPVTAARAPTPTPSSGEVAGPNMPAAAAIVPPAPRAAPQWVEPNAAKARVWAPLPAGAASVPSPTQARQPRPPAVPNGRRGTSSAAPANPQRTSAPTPQGTDARAPAPSVAPAVSEWTVAQAKKGAPSKSSRKAVLAAAAAADVAVLAPKASKLPATSAAVAEIRPTSPAMPATEAPLRSWPALLEACEATVGQQEVDEATAISPAALRRHTEALGKEVLALSSLRRWAAVWARAASSKLPLAAPALHLVQRIAAQHAGLPRFATEMTHVLTAVCALDVERAWHLHTLLFDAALTALAPAPVATAMPLLLQAPPTDARSLQMAASLLNDVAASTSLSLPLVQGARPPLQQWLQVAATRDAAAKLALTIRKRSQEWVRAALAVLDDEGAWRLLTTTDPQAAGYRQAMKLILCEPRRELQRDAEPVSAERLSARWMALIRNWTAYLEAAEGVQQLAALAGSELRDPQAYAQLWLALVALDRAPQHGEVRVMQALALPSIEHLRATERALRTSRKGLQALPSVVAQHLYSAQHSGTRAAAVQVLHFSEPWAAEMAALDSTTTAWLQADLIRRLHAEPADAPATSMGPASAALWFEILRRCDRARCERAAQGQISAQTVWDALSRCGFMAKHLMADLPIEQMMLILKMRPDFLQEPIDPPSRQQDPTGAYSLVLGCEVTKPAPLFASAERAATVWEMPKARANKIAASVWLQMRLLSQHHLLVGDEAGLGATTVLGVNFEGEEVASLLANEPDLQNQNEAKLFNSLKEAVTGHNAFIVDVMNKRLDDKGLRRLLAHDGRASASCAATHDGTRVLLDAIAARHRFVPVGAAEKWVKVVGNHVASNRVFADRLCSYIEGKCSATPSQPLGLSALVPLASLLQHVGDIERSRDTANYFLIRLGAFEFPCSETSSHSGSESISINARAESLAACLPALLRGASAEELETLAYTCSSMIVRCAKRTLWPARKLLMYLYNSEAAKEHSAGPAAYCVGALDTGVQSVAADVEHYDRAVMWTGLAQIATFIAPSIDPELALGVAGLLKQYHRQEGFVLKSGWAQFAANSPLFETLLSGPARARTEGASSSALPFRSELALVLQQISLDEDEPGQDDAAKQLRQLEGEFLLLQRRCSADMVFNAASPAETREAMTLHMSLFDDGASDLDRTAPVVRSQRWSALLDDEATADILKQVSSEMPANVGVSADQLVMQSQLRRGRRFEAA